MKQFSANRDYVSLTETVYVKEDLENNSIYNMCNSVDGVGNQSIAIQITGWY